MKAGRVTDWTEDDEAAAVEEEEEEEEEEKEEEVEEFGSHFRKSSNKYFVTLQTPLLSSFANSRVFPSIVRYTNKLTSSYESKPVELGERLKKSFSVCSIRVVWGLEE